MVKQKHHTDKPDKFTDYVLWTGILIFVIGLIIVTIPGLNWIFGYFLGSVIVMAFLVTIRNIIVVQRKKVEQARLPLEDRHDWQPEKWLGARCTKCNVYGNFPSHVNHPHLIGVGMSREGYGQQVDKEA